ncbi:hypothetical protein [Legionella hackeliae]|uniref:Uncharacterized protein n=1 Tax=Legionella hackeliae TaxID=449 RepID=A0A0A8UM37_LEGHA|nr:hypothetical protein [Legionella hackeliae]KTD10442.1 hypothetical protein Lhac_2810 [Legionella hackeliae]CEK09940.1 protein of unknown function [Legionella hackeliae]STX49857.1 Uncharacterised protein [Legionella hackeliae]
MIISDYKLKQYPELNSFLKTDQEEEILQQSKLLAHSYAGLTTPSEIKLTPIEIAAYFNKKIHVRILLSLPILPLGNYPQLVGYVLKRENNDSQSMDQHSAIATLFTDASQFVELNKMSYEAATCLVKHNDACKKIIDLFKSSQQFIELAKGSSSASQWMLFDEPNASKVIQLFKKSSEFNELAPNGGTVEAFLSHDSVCEIVAGLYTHVDEFLDLARRSEPLRSASARLVGNARSTETIAKLFPRAEKFIELSELCPLTAQYLTIPKPNCIIIAKLFKSQEQFSKFVATKCISAHYLVLYDEPCKLLARLFTNTKQLQQLDETMKNCSFIYKTDCYVTFIGKHLDSKQQLKFFKPEDAKDTSLQAPPGYEC